MDAWSLRLLTTARIGLRLLSDREIDWVERTSLAARRTHLDRAAMVISWLGNGAIYVLLALPLLAYAGSAAWRGLGLAALCGAISHVVYPWIKRAGDRPRPFELRNRLVPPLAPLDAHSFPSGHMMTLSATLTPALVVWPDLWPAAAALWLAMAWSRLACAHHYPSDVIGGTLLGVAVALPVTRLVF